MRKHSHVVLHGIDRPLNTRTYMAIKLNTRWLTTKQIYWQIRDDEMRIPASRLYLCSPCTSGADEVGATSTLEAGPVNLSTKRV